MNKIYIVLMRNLIGENKQHIQRIFDLKGSTYKRNALELGADRKTIKKMPETAYTVLKDLDLMNLGEYICMSAEVKSHFLKAVEIDSQLLN